MFEHDNEEGTAKSTFTRRTMLVGGVQAAAFSLLGWRLFKLQVVDQGKYVPLAEENRINLQILAPKRGRILDRRGTVLADNEEMFRATLTPALAGDVPTVLALFRRIVPITADEAEKVAKRAKKQSRNTAIIIATDLTFEQVAQINLYAPHLPGVRTEIFWRRRYRQGPAAGHVVGYVGSIERPSINDDPVKRLPGVRVGKTGIEIGMETVLCGEGGAQKIEVDARGRIVRNLELVEPVAGRDVALTLEMGLQRRIADRLLRERRASCVVIDVAGGEIVAMASSPGYDPSDIVDAASDEIRQRIFTSEEKPMLNRATGGLYPPGSTFKVVTAVAALQAGRTEPKEQIKCEGHYELADRKFRCWNRTGHGQVDLRRAIKESCDVYFFEMARRLGIETLSDTARLLGLGVTYDLGLPHKTGVVPDPDWKRGQWDTRWLGGETLLTGIGQGYVLSTPLQLAADPLSRRW
jgi:penicillin-binding protein 2